MTDGMKSGAGDPFAEDTTSSDDVSSGEQATDKTSDSEAEPQTDSESISDTVSQDTETDWGGNELPYIHERNTVKSDRDQITYFLRDEIQELEDRSYRAIEEELEGASVSRIDFREALVIIGANHLDEVATELRDWGYRFEED